MIGENKLRAYYGFTRYTLHQKLDLTPPWNSSPWYFEDTGTSVAINPDITGSFNVWDNLFLNVHVGYAIDSKGWVDLTNPSGQMEVRFDWSSFRLGLSARISFS